MARLHLTAIGYLSLLLAMPVNGAEPVIDTSNLGKTTIIADEAKKQTQGINDTIDKIGEANSKLQNQIDALGKMSKITLPFVDQLKLVSQIKKDLQCMVPDWESLLPGFKFEDLNFNSVCQARHLYRDTLWYNNDEYEKADTEQKRQIRMDIQKRRKNVFNDTVEKSLALADMGKDKAIKALSASDEVNNNLLGAEDLQTKFAALTQATLANNRAQAETNLLLSQMLKLQATVALQMGVSVHDILPTQESSIQESEDKND